VYLFGSLVWGKHYTSLSDIDLMIEGFPPDQRYFRALAMAESMAQPISIQLVLSEDAFPSLTERVKKEGILL
jgi:predicted nucleotidyltransferase